MMQVMGMLLSWPVCAAAVTAALQWRMRLLLVRPLAAPPQLTQPLALAPAPWQQRLQPQ
jgi:hypothetical protein